MFKIRCQTYKSEQISITDDRWCKHPKHGLKPKKRSYLIIILLYWKIIPAVSINVQAKSSSGDHDNQNRWFCQYRAILCKLVLKVAMYLSCLLFIGRRRWSGAELSEYLWSYWWSVFSFLVHLLGVSGRHFLSWVIGGAVLLQTRPMYVEERQVISFIFVTFIPWSRRILFLSATEAKKPSWPWKRARNRRENLWTRVVPLFTSVSRFLAHDLFMKEDVRPYQHSWSIDDLR